MRSFLTIPMSLGVTFTFFRFFQLQLKNLGKSIHSNPS
ncbi:hypothetical protein LEP1GSC017_0012 [Leptospira meyeri serovar Hardjo str. Went 5]|nr:hypothetical protein LEP1GSC017_0012 [Leptospira meyeri serovar Hardjo str. Went 5]